MVFTSILVFRKPEGRSRSDGKRPFPGLFGGGKAIYLGRDRCVSIGRLLRCLPEEFVLESLSSYSAFQLSGKGYRCGGVLYEWPTISHIFFLYCRLLCDALSFDIMCALWWIIRMVFWKYTLIHVYIYPCVRVCVSVTGATTAAPGATTAAPGTTRTFTSTPWG